MVYPPISKLIKKLFQIQVKEMTDNYYSLADPAITPKLINKLKIHKDGRII
jgi:hypothetical protein